MRRSSARTFGRGTRGQALAELALVLPIMLGMAGVTGDVARVYTVWSGLETGVRQASQWIASDPALWSTGGYYDAYDTVNRCGTTADVFPCSTAPTADAVATMQRETGVTFTAATSAPDCSTATTPTVYAVIPTAPSTSAAAGGNAQYPVATAAVTACMPFRTLVPWPFITDLGTWHLRSSRTYTVIVGR